MRFRHLTPSPALSDFVDYYFIVESKSTSETHPVEVFPSPQLEMTFTFGAPDTSYVTSGAGDTRPAEDYSVTGFTTSKSVYTNQDDLGVVMVGFKPWGIQNFLDFDVGQLTNRTLDLKNAWPADLRVLEDQVRAVASDAARIGVIENFLLSILRSREQDRMVIEAVHRIVSSNGNRPIRELSRDFHLSQKQFIRRFKRTVGVSPKLFSRIIRFQSIMDLMKTRQFRLLDVALEAGFFDQAHFIKEFREFTGESPRVYLSSRYQTELGRYFEDCTEKSIFYNSVYR